MRAGAPAVFEFAVPGDPSSAAFWCVAAAITPGSEVTIVDVGLNPTRLGYVDVLRRMGVTIEVRVTGEQLGEPVGELHVGGASLVATTIGPHEMANVQDEIPVLAVAAAFAEGVTEITGAAELRVKESDRIATVAALLDGLGVGVETADDGLAIRGGSPRAGRFDSRGDHRIALAAAVAAHAIDGESSVSGWGAASVSYPEFLDDLADAHWCGGLSECDVTARVIAIDGPAGSGKSTVGRGVAAALGLHTLDTGAMYRSATLAAMLANVALDDEAAVTAVASAAHIELLDGVVELDGRDVASEIRGPDVTNAVSTVASHPAVRAVMVVRQRAWVEEHDGGVVEGRDIGTVVLPDAPLKVFLTARDDVRAARRQRDEAAAEREVAVADVQAAIDTRDRADAGLGRALRPEDAADDALVIDTSVRTADEVIAEIVARAQSIA